MLNIFIFCMKKIDISQREWCFHFSNSCIIKGVKNFSGHVPWPKLICSSAVTPPPSVNLLRGPEDKEVNLFRMEVEFSNGIPVNQTINLKDLGIYIILLFPFCIYFYCFVNPALMIKPLIRAEPEPLGKKNQQPEPPKNKSGARAAKQLAGSSALPLILVQQD